MLAHPDAVIVPERPREEVGDAPPRGRSRERRDIRYAHSESFPHLLAILKSSLLISTYRTGNLVCLASQGNHLGVSFHTFERPMGLAVKESGIAVGTRDQVWFLRSAPDITSKLDPPGRYDASFLARYSHFTGDIHCHEMAWISQELWIVNTLFSCLCTLHPAYHFAPRWRPPFISSLAPEDRCHLNGLATAEGRARYVTAMAKSDQPQGWRGLKATAGCVIEVESGQVVSHGLCMPHSPRLSRGRLFVLNSGLGRLEQVDPATGQRESVCQLPGYARGLSILSGLAFVGLSRIRLSSAWDGVPITAHPEQLKCGVWVVELASGAIVGHFEWQSNIDELFDVQLLGSAAAPYLSGPLAEHDTTAPVWTVMRST